MQICQPVASLSHQARGPRNPVAEVAGPLDLFKGEGKDPTDPFTLYGNARCAFWSAERLSIALHTSAVRESAFSTRQLQKRTP